MASGNSAYSPSNAARGGGGGGAWPGGIQLGNGKGVWGDDSQEIFLFMKYVLLESLIFFQKHKLNIGCNTPRWDLC